MLKVSGAEDVETQLRSNEGRFTLKLAVFWEGI
jgi:hypothetical protein